MEISIAQQTGVFLLAAVLGFALGILYDFFRTLRMLLHAKRLLTAVFDLLYCVLVLLLTFLFILLISRGQVRVYVFLGAALGAMLYFTTLSLVVIKAFKLFYRFSSKVYAKGRGHANKVYERVRAHRQKRAALMQELRAQKKQKRQKNREKRARRRRSHKNNVENNAEKS